MNRLLLIVLFFSLVFGSCSKEDSNTAPIDLGTTYYPTDIGKFVIYDVDSTIYTDLSKDTLVYKYRIKEKLIEEFTDNLGKPAIKIERSIKKFDPTVSYDNMPWKIKEVWTLSYNQSSIQVVESNLRFTKLVFPVQEKSTWNGNAFNSLGEQNYYYDYIDKTETIGTINLSKVLKVKQKEIITLISHQVYSEKYAKGVGLVYREMSDLQSNNILPNVPVTDRIEQGIIYKQTLYAYGFE